MSGELDLQITDLEGAVRTWVNAQSALAAFLPNGVQLSNPRSPSRGAISSLAVTGDAGSDNRCDRRTVEFRVVAVGERGGRAESERAARALATVLPRCVNTVVATPSGEQVLLIAIRDVGGPFYAGQTSGQAVHSVTATAIAQQAAGSLV